MKQSDVDEALAVLYLRLNGYFTTGLIIHSAEHGRATTEVDCIAIRMPNHQQTDRVVDDAPFLKVEPGLTDLIVCEVKSNAANVVFNNPLKTDLQAIKALLQWAGAYPDNAIASVAEGFQPLLADDADPDSVVSGIVAEGVRVRGLLCCPTCEPTTGARWLLDGAEILRYADECFNPAERRETCSVRYNFQQWSYPLSRIVTWIKDGRRQTPLTVDGLYQHLEVDGLYQHLEVERQV